MCGLSLPKESRFQVHAFDLVGIPLYKLIAFPLRMFLITEPLFNMTDEPFTFKSLMNCPSHRL